MEDAKDFTVEKQEVPKPRIGRPKKRIFTTKDQEEAYNKSKLEARANYKKQYYNANKKWYLAKSKSVQIEKTKLKLKTLEDDLADLMRIIQIEVEQDMREEKE